ncbi:MAG: hypothetical protein II736_04920, partial [Clostridia bacterium]|nr:hypothetical protein [Clostridia bacterium]
KSDVFADADGVLSVYHMQDEQSEPEFVASVDAVDSAVTFDAESFSIYAVGSVIEKTIVAEDGYTYKITVIYDESAGIPDDAELNVSEISSADMLRTAAETVGSGVESISYAKMFDISIVKDGVEYQPNENVKVSVELLDAGEVSDVQVVHFDSETEAAPLAAETDGNTVTFETEGFSVFSFLDFSVFDEIISAVLGETEGVLYENDDIILTGKMPATAVVEANRVDVDIKGKPALIAYDIKIYAHPVMKLLGINWQPTEGAIKVSLKSDALAGHNNLKVYHMADLDSEPELVSRVHIPDSTVEFDAESFSVYPVGEAETPSRIFYTFYNGGTVLANEYVTARQNASTGAWETVGFFDPGVSPDYGQTFLGWAFDPAETDENLMYKFEGDQGETTLTTKLEEVLAGTYEDGHEIKVYARFKEAYYLRYIVMDGDGTIGVLKTESVRVDAADKTVMVNCPYSDATAQFEGWIDSTSGDVYQNNETITLDHHIDLYAKIEGRYWLVFVANTTGATFTGPQLIYDAYVTHKPSDPNKRGYYFLGWNT